MSSALLRAGQAEDLPGLRALWPLCFEDEPSFQERFFSQLFHPEYTAVAEQDGQIVAAAYALPGFIARIPGRELVPASYLYGVGTHPDFRGHGLGAAVSRLAAELAGRPLCCLLPGEESLRLWYAERLHAVDLTSYIEYMLPKEKAEPVLAPLQRLDAASYLRRREELLKNLPHMETPYDFMQLADEALTSSGGGLFELGYGIAAVERFGTSVCVKELLLTPGIDSHQAAKALAGHFPAESFSVRLPAYSSASEHCKPFAMAFSLQELPPAAPGLWWGLALD